MFYQVVLSFFTALALCLNLYSAFLKETTFNDPKKKAEVIVKLDVPVVNWEAIEEAIKSSQNIFPQEASSSTGVSPATPAR